MNDTNKIVDEELSVKAIIFIIMEWLLFLRKKWVLIVSFLAIGVIIGVFYSILSEKKYTAKTSFILQESRDNAVSQIPSGLAFLGINLRSESGLYTGNNLMWLYTSRAMLRKTLTTKVDSVGKQKLLIDWLIEIDDDLKDLYNTVKSNNPSINFLTNKDSTIYIQQNRILGKASDLLKANYLTIASDPDATAITTVVFTSSDELFSKLFLEALVDNVNSSYIESKTQRTMEQVELLENKIDELSSSLSTSMKAAATLSNSNPNLNPVRQVLKVESQKESINVQANSSMYIQMLQQLEAAKLTLSKETPLIQIVEEPILPLELQKVNLIKSIIISGIIGLILGITLLTFLRYINLVIRSHN